MIQRIYQPVLKKGWSPPDLTGLDPTGSQASTDTQVSTDNTLRIDGLT